MSKKIFMSVLITFFFFCVTGRAMVPSPRRVDPFTKMAKQQDYVPNQIIVKYKEGTAKLVEKEMAKRKPGKNLVVSASLDRLNKKLKLKNVRPVFKNFKQNSQKIQDLKNRSKAQLTKRERRILKRQKRAPKNIDIPALDRIYLIEVESDPAVSLEDLVEEYNNDPEVEYAELNYYVTACTAPNDPYYSLQWALTKIDAEEGWDLAVHENDVVVAVIDSGVDYNHLDLQGSMWTNEAEAQGSAGVDDDGNGYVDDIYGYDFCAYQVGSRDGDPLDDHGHGTHCAGIIAAKINNSTDIAGTSLNAKIMALKFLNYSGSGVTSDAVASIYYATDHGVDILSNSWGGSEASYALQDAIDYVYAQGALFVAAAGNDSKGYVYGHPSSDENVLNVAAVNSYGYKASFSNYGDWVDVAAPGVDILSLRAAGTDMYNSGGQNFYPPYDPNATSYYASGTSMACPYVSGICAVLLESDPTLSVDEITDVLLETGDVLPQDDVCLSDRCVNLADALDYVYTNPKGRVATDRDTYSCSDTIKITLCDGDLELPDTQSVTVTTTAGDSETVELAEANVATYFMGYLTTDPNVISLNNGVLQVDPNDTITVTYYDLDDGSGDPDPNATCEATALVDCQGPVITDIEMEVPGPRPAVYFTTDELTTATIHYGLECEEPYDTVIKSVLETEHRVVIDGVSPDTTYYYYIEAEDSAGNVTLAPDSGDCYSFTTTAVGNVYVPADAATIQKGVDYCWDSGTVVVSPGIYTEYVHIFDRAITVQSTDPDNWDVVEATVINYNNVDNEVYYAVSLNDSEVTIKGFSIMNNFLAGVASYDSDSVISNCIIDGENNSGWFTPSGGVICNDPGTLTINNCQIQNNYTGVWVVDTYAFNGGALDLNIRNSIIHNSVYNVFRMGASEEGSTNIVNSTIVNAYSGLGGSCENVTITNSIFWDIDEFPDVQGDWSVTYSCIEDGDAGTGNISSDPYFVDPDNGNYHLSGDSPCISEGDNSAVNSGEKDIDNQNRIIGGDVDMGFDECAIQNLNNGLSYNTVQAAINDADTDDEIVVYPGTYNENIDFGGMAITLTSTDPDDWDVVAVTIIDTTDEWVNSVTFESGEDPNSVLKGFTIRGNSSYYGIRCDDSSPTIGNCIIEGSMYGVGCGSASPAISNCIVRDNNMSGIECYSSSPVISNCIVENNGYRGIVCSASSPVIRNSTIVNNDCYGVYCSGSSATITNCILWGNPDGDLYGCSATYSCIEDGDAGEGNLSSDPCFVDLNNGDYHLASNSPCIDAGDPCGSYDGQMDIDSEARVMLGQIDMGADEFKPTVHNIDQDIWYLTISDAIDDADDDDEIVVYPGTYYENIDFDGKSITLRSSAPTNWDIVAATIIETADEWVNSVTFESGEDPNSVLKGFTIRDNLYNSGIRCVSSSPTIGNCIIEGSMNGVSCISASSPVISNCIVRDNSMSGIECGSASPVISNCIVENNSYRGIDCYSNSYPVIRNSVIVNNSDGGVYCLSGSSATVINCILWGNPDGDLYGCSATYSCIEDGDGGTGNIDDDPLFAANDPFYHLTPHSPCISAGDPNGNYDDQTDIDNQPRILHGIVDMGADEAQDVAVLNITQDIAYRTIQAAIDDSDEEDEIVVSPGTYEEAIDFDGKSITLRSSDPDDWDVVESTIIDATNLGGDGIGENGENGVTFASGEDPNSVLKGITIRTSDIRNAVHCSSSSPTISNCIMEYAQFGVWICNSSSPEISDCIVRDTAVTGISCLASSPVISNCIVEENNNGDYGIDCRSGSPVISNCTLANNATGIRCLSGSPVISNCILANNDYDGIYCSSSSAVISNCIVDNNGRWGIHVAFSSPKISNCVVVNNGWDGIVCYSSSPVISNCIVDNNGRWGIYCYSFSNPLIRNSTIVNNGDEGVYCYSGSAATISNCIIWGNFEEEIYGSATVTYSCVEDGGTANNNIEDDPLFVDDDPLYHLTSISPCINAGDPNGNYDGQTDIDGDVRVIGGNVDMGSDEFKEGVHNVDQNIWYLIIQDAIDDADDDDEIVVYPGTYEENIDFDGKAITVTSTDPDDWDVVAVTIIDTTDEWVNGVTFESGEDPNSVLKGFTIRGNFMYYGIRCDGSSPTIGNCIIEGGMNGISCVSASPAISNCIVRDSSMTGISCSASSPVISNCIVENNGYRGIVCSASSPVIRNSVIVNNSDGGVYCSGSSATVINCILWGNDENEIYGSATVTYSDVDVTPVYTGTGNINSDPCFVDLNNGDYSLTSVSPCIDAADGDAAPATDIDGQGRYDDPYTANTGDGDPDYVDMGAFEYQGD